MLTKASDWLNCHLTAEDGNVGRVEDLYFEDDTWCLKYFLVDCGQWRPRRKMLFPVHLIETVDWASRFIPLSLTRTQIRENSSVDFSTTLPWQLEKDLYEYFRWPSYWHASIYHSPEYSKMSPPPSAPRADGLNGKLHSLREITGYQVEAHDGDIGHLADIMLNERVPGQNWEIAYFVLNIDRGKEHDHQVLLAPHWLKEIKTPSATIVLALNQSTIRSSPEFDFKMLDHVA